MLNVYFCFFRQGPSALSLVFLSGGFLGELRITWDWSRQRARCANEIPLEALKHAVIRYNYVGNTLTCVLVVCAWCRSANRRWRDGWRESIFGKAEPKRFKNHREEIEREKRESVYVCIRSCRQTPLVWTVRSRCSTAAPVCVCKWVCVSYGEAWSDAKLLPSG